MQTHTKRWIPITIFLLLATLGYTLQLRSSAPQTPCRPFSEMCQPERQPPQCQPMLCPDTD